MPRTNHNPPVGTGGGSGGATALDGLTDVELTATPYTAGRLLRANGTQFVDDVLVASDIPDISATYATVSHNQAWSTITATPTTIAGYGITDSLALGETSTTAYRGDRGKTAYDHTLLTTNPHSVTAAQAGAVALTGNETIAGIKTFSSIPQSAGTPTASNDLVNFAYISAIVQGLIPKDSCRVATTANITLSGEQTIDAVAVVAGDRVLVKNQSTGTQNGIYVCAAGAWSRATDYDASAEVQEGTFTFVSLGTAGGGYQWAQFTIDPVLDTSTLTFSMVGKTTTYTGSLGVELVGADFRADLLSTGAIGLTGNELKVNVDASSIEIATNALQVKALGITYGMLAGSIPDSKLDQITTASKVSSTAIAGIGALVQGDIIYGSGTDTLALLNKSATATRYLSNTGTSNNPAWAQVNLANGVTGELPDSNLATISTASKVSWVAVNKTGSILDDIADVNVGAATNGQAITWDGTTSAWIPASIPTGTTVNAAVMDVDVVSTSQTAQTWANLPVAVNELFLNKYSRIKVDLSYATHYRIIANVSAIASKPTTYNADLNLRYSTSATGASDAFTTFSAADTAAAGECAIPNVSVYVGAWAELVAGAKADVWLTIVGKDGNAAADPSFRQIRIQFKMLSTGGEAPANAQYLTLATNTTLSDERALTPGTSLTVTDDGAGGHYHIDAIQDIQTSAGPTFDHSHMTTNFYTDHITENSASHGVIFDDSIAVNTTINLRRAINAATSAVTDEDYVCFGATATADASVSPFTSGLYGFLGGAVANTNITTATWGMVGLDARVNIGADNVTVKGAAALVTEIRTSAGTARAYTSAYGIYMKQAIGAGGSIGTYYGLYMPDNQVGTTKYGIDIEDDAAGNIFKGWLNVGAGTTADAAGELAADNIYANTAININAAAPIIGFNETSTGNYRIGVDVNKLLIDYDEGADGGGDYGAYTRIEIVGGVNSMTLRPIVDGELAIGDSTYPIGSICIDSGKNIGTDDDTDLLAFAANNLTVNGNITLGENAIVLDSAISADEKWSGIVIAGIAAAALAVGDLVYMDANADWALADADAATTSGSTTLGICVLAAAGHTSATNILLYGTIASAAFPAFTTGQTLYVSTTAGDMTATQPSGTDDVIRVVGHALNATDLLFQPSSTYWTHT